MEEVAGARQKKESIVKGELKGELKELKELKEELKGGLGKGELKELKELKEEQGELGEVIDDKRERFRRLP